MNESHDMRRREIADLNDQLRTTMDRKHGHIMMTAGVAALPSDVQVILIRRVATFTEFSKEQNDPWGEHDFGKVTIAGQDFFWKIDCYEKGSDLTAGAETPEDAATCDRVLTIMRADEY
jgi:hypothetical protein